MKTIQTYVSEINSALTASKAASKKVFELLFDAQSSLSSKDYKQLRSEIDVDKSTINKIEKIFDNAVVMENIDCLPIAWSVLYEMSLIEEHTLQSYISDSSVHSKSSRKEVALLRKPTVEPAATSASTLNDEPTAVASTNNEENVASARVITLTIKANVEMSQSDIDAEIEKVMDLMSKNFIVTKESDNNLDEAA